MTLEEIKAKSDNYFDWPNKKDRNYITYTSAMLFAWDCAKDVTEQLDQEKHALYLSWEQMQTQADYLLGQLHESERLNRKKQKAIEELSHIIFNRAGKTVEAIKKQVAKEVAERAHIQALYEFEKWVKREYLAE